jgi:hypothetical protein
MYSLFIDLLAILMTHVGLLMISVYSPGDPDFLPAQLFNGEYHVPVYILFEPIYQIKISTFKLSKLLN